MIRETVVVLVPLAVALTLTAIGVLVVAKVTAVTLRRLGLETESVLVWLGLAEPAFTYLAWSTTSDSQSATTSAASVSTSRRLRPLDTRL